jgi:hypothetical protein
MTFVSASCTMAGPLDQARQGVQPWLRLPDPVPIRTQGAERTAELGQSTAAGVGDRVECGLSARRIRADH